ncbi:hypothetical protein K438DRAFT_1795011 [Mycena galopus ATCC 62051]|nr:hypothetical protein K438DRAFT_1795011 [Mycena galopus ATCC 62051]
MFFKLPLLLLGFVAISHAADIFMYMIKDFQGSMLGLTNPGLTSLNPVVSVKNGRDEGQYWAFIYAARGDTSEYEIVNGFTTNVSSILSYSTVNDTTPGTAYHSQVVGNQDVTTFWDVLFVKNNKKADMCRFVEKVTGLAITAWPAGTGNGTSRASPVTLEQSDVNNPRQTFILMNGRNA